MTRRLTRDQRQAVKEVVFLWCGLRDLLKDSIEEDDEQALDEELKRIGTAKERP